MSKWLVKCFRFFFSCHEIEEEETEMDCFSRSVEPVTILPPSQPPTPPQTTPPITTSSTPTPIPSPPTKTSSPSLTLDKPVLKRHKHNTQFLESWNIVPSPSQQLP